MADEIELAVVAKAIAAEDGMKEMRARGVVADAFGEDGRRLWDFVEAFVREHGALPSRDAVEVVLGGRLPALETLPDPPGYYAQKLTARWQANIISIAWQMMNDPEKPMESVEAAKVMLEAGTKVLSISAAKDSMIAFNSEETFKATVDDYARVKALGGKIDGLPTPWPSINQATRGIHDDEMWVVLGAKKSAKTWNILLMALNVWSLGENKVLLVSEEMGVWKILRRVHAVRSKLPYGDFIAGKLPTLTEEKWFADAKAVLDKESFLVAGRSRASTVVELEALIRDVKPRCVFVDGAYFLDPGEKTKSKWEKTSAVVDQLQAMVLRTRVPLVISWQFNRPGSKQNNKKGKGGDAGDGLAGSEEVAFAFELTMAADVVLGIYRDDAMAKAKEAIVRIIESREGPKADPIYVNCDFATMDFSEKLAVASDGVKQDGDPREPGSDDDEPLGGGPAADGAQQGISF